MATPTNGGGGSSNPIAMLKWLLQTPAALPTVVVVFIGYEFHQLLEWLRYYVLTTSAEHEKLLNLLIRMQQQHDALLRLPPT